MYKKINKSFTMAIEMLKRIVMIKEIKQDTITVVQENMLLKIA